MWESAVPPCTCALAAFIVCMRGVRVLAPTRADLSHTYTRGTFRLLLVRPVTNHPRKIVRHFTVRDPVRPSYSPVHCHRTY